MLPFLFVICPLLVLREPVKPPEPQARLAPGRGHLAVQLLHRTAGLAARVSPWPLSRPRIVAQRRRLEGDRHPFPEQRTLQLLEVREPHQKLERHAQRDGVCVGKMDLGAGVEERV